MENYTPLPPQEPDDRQVEISDLDPREFPLSPVGGRIYQLLRLRPRWFGTWRGSILFCWLALLLACVLLALVSWPWPFLQKQATSIPPVGSTGIAPSLALVLADQVVYIQTPDGSVLAERAGDGQLLWRTHLGGTMDCGADGQLLSCLVTLKGGTSLQTLREQDGRVLWSQHIAASAAVPSLLVQGGQLYVGTRDGWLEVWRAADGKRLWSYRYARSLARPLPDVLTVEQGIAIVRTPDGVSHLLRTSDGSEVMRYVGDGDLPQIDNGIIYLVLGFHTLDETDGTLQALNEADGRLLWRETLRTNQNWVPVEIEGTVYAGSPDGAILAFRGTDGARIWSYRGEQAVIGAPTGAHGRIYALSQDGSLIALRASDGKLLWRTRIASFARFSSYTPLLVGGQLFLKRFVSRGSVVYSVRTSDGSILWFHDMGSNDALHAPILFSGIFYLLQNDGSLDAWRTSDGAHIWRYPAPSDPIEEIVGKEGAGILYLLTFYNSVVALQSSDGRVLWRLGPFAAG